MRITILLLTLFAAVGCGYIKPQKGGTSTTTLGGASQPTTVSTVAPENPKTPTVTTVEKTTTREFDVSRRSEGDEVDPGAQTATRTTGLQNSTGHVTRAVVAPVAPRPLDPSSPPLLRETVTERATTQTGAAQKDTARELGAKLANMRLVMWFGILLMIAGPVIGWKLGWFTNGCIAGAVGLLLVILAQILPGNEAWFGLGGLLLIPLVGFVYYRAHHDGRLAAIFQPSSPNNSGS